MSDAKAMRNTQVRNEDRSNHGAQGRWHIPWYAVTTVGRRAERLVTNHQWLAVCVPALVTGDDLLRRSDEQVCPLSASQSVIMTWCLSVCFFRLIKIIYSSYKITNAGSDVHMFSIWLSNNEWPWAFFLYYKSIGTWPSNWREVSRCKYNMVIAEAIDPKLNGEEYMDRADNENELKQVLDPPMIWPHALVQHGWLATPMVDLYLMCEVMNVII